MSDAVGALSDTIKMYRSHPLSLIVAGVVYIVITLLGFIIPVFGGLVTTPILTAGLYGLLLRARKHGDIKSRAALRTIDRYVGDLIAGYIIQGVVFIGLIIVLIFLLATIPADASIETITRLGRIIIGVTAVLFVVTYVAIQFFPIIIVREGVGPATAFFDSVAFVRKNMVSVAAYSALKLTVIGALYGLGPYVVSLSASSEPTILSWFGLLLFMCSLVVVPVVSASMHVSYYERRRTETTH